MSGKQPTMFLAPFLSLETNKKVANPELLVYLSSRMPKHRVLPELSLQELPYPLLLNSSSDNPQVV